jgi:hypothetical protein
MRSPSTNWQLPIEGLREESQTTSRTPSGTLCCNASCGICVPPGYFCHQMACNTP